MKTLQRGLTAVALGAVTFAMASTFIPACSSGGGGFDGGGCTGTQTQCGAACVEVAKDHDNCGACGKACKVGEVCSSGACATSCGTGTTQCGMTCVDTKNDPQNCGVCGKTCGAGEVCSAGTCASTCGQGQTKCGGDGGAPYCANTATDNANCGTCGKTCGAGEVCSAGTCASTCGQGQTKCGGDGGAPYCANTSTDNANCGACGVTCGQGKVCSMGQCASTCQQNQTMCGGDGGPVYCADTQNDNTNCGACGVTCGVLQACINGACQSACGDGGVQTLCAGDGGPAYCANLQTDNANCGTCGKTCTNVQSCQAGICQTIGSSPATCVELVANPTIWGKACTGFDLRKRTKSTMHFLGCIDSENCTFYCTYDAQNKTLSFGTKGVNAMRAQVDPNNTQGDTFAVGSYACCSAQNPNGVCNAPDSVNNGVAVNGAKALCNALGYQNGTYVRQTATNSCPQAHTVDTTGTNWTSDWVGNTGEGMEYQCSGF